MSSLPVDYPVGSAVLQIRWALPDERRDEFERWYDEVHLPEMLAIPGVLAGRRFDRLETEFSSSSEFGPVIAYQLCSLETAVSPELRALEAAPPTKRTIGAVGGLRHSRTVFTLLEPAKFGTRRPAGRATLHVLMAVQTHCQPLFDRWYEDEHLPQMRAVPGILDGTRYEVAESDDGSPGGMRYLTVYEMASVRVIDTEEFRATSVPSAVRVQIGTGLTSHVQLLCERAGTNRIDASTP